MSDIFGWVGQLADSPLLVSVAPGAEDFACEDLDTDPPRLLEVGLTSGDEELEDAEEAALVALVDVPRDFLVGGSSREEPFIEFRFPWDGLLLFSDLERLLDPPEADTDWPDGVGEFTGTLRRSPIVALAIIPGYIQDRQPVSLGTIDSPFFLTLSH